MKRSYLVRQEFVLGRVEAVVELSQGEVGGLALELALLLNEMASSLSLRSPVGQRIELVVDSHAARATVERLAETELRFALARNQVEFLQAVLLRAYRDDAAEVNHVHIEGRTPADRGAMDLTLVFKTYKAAMSAEEAAAAMGD